MIQITVSNTVARRKRVSRGEMRDAGWILRTNMKGFNGESDTRVSGSGRRHPTNELKSNEVRSCAYWYLASIGVPRCLEEE